MKGHDALLQMRRGGKAPAIVFVECEQDRFKQWRDWHVVSPAMACIWIEPADVPAALDLRCLVGLVVSISGNNDETVERVRKACIQAGAKQVVSTLSALDDRGEPRITRITDTTGGLECPT